MTIDWTKPVETTEDPPRPVRVLADDAHGAWPIVGMIDGLIVRITVEGKSSNGCFCIRNVAPKPVLREIWVNCYDPRHFEPGVHPTKELADHYSRTGREACIRLAWNSDGSPVESELLPEYMAMMTQDREACAATAEALQAEVDDLKTTQTDALAFMASSKPVVDAAVEYFSLHISSENLKRAQALEEAVRAWKNRV